MRDSEEDVIKKLIQEALRLFDGKSYFDLMYAEDGRDCIASELMMLKWAQHYLHTADDLLVRVEIEFAAEPFKALLEIRKNLIDFEKDVNNLIGIMEERKKALGASV